MATLIRTRSGKTMTARRYVALKRAQDASDADHQHDCIHGHFECAAWDRGPCIDEVISSIEETEGADWE